MMTCNFRKISDESGYTLIEVLVSLVIFLIILVPTTYFISYLLTNPQNMDKINAVNLAEKVMETSIAGKLYFDDESTEEVSGRQYRLVREISREGNLVTISISVFLPSKKRKIVEFSTVRSFD
jgi:prepilin-type N-terminal cleavage/methylation domain-containing protein